MNSSPDALEALTDIAPALDPDQIEALNRDCFCISLDESALGGTLAATLGSPQLVQLVRERCPHLFSAQPVFVRPSGMERMADIIRAIESVVASPAWHERVLPAAPEIARPDPGVRGVFIGYDFHLGAHGPALIEINTNAGGLMLNAILARAQRACCPQMQGLVPSLNDIDRLEKSLISMFRKEWLLSGHDRPLRSIAIVDESPEQQYLYPEFVLFQRLFEQHGFRAVIAAPEQLVLKDGRLWCDQLEIDLIYNRLTDFMLEQPGHQVLRQAYLERTVVLTPHPRAHALYADKRNLALLTDQAELQSLAVPKAMQDILLAGIPRTEMVRLDQAERLWRERKQLFFKPAAGYGSRAAYRGDKLTTRVWQEILSGDYVAQALVPPGERRIGSIELPQTLKFDVRHYVYDGHCQWVAARLYQGQTTNFRTPGGGFAPVYSRVGSLA